MSERRKHDRVQREVQFNCYIDGQRFDTASVNISEGGAFLSTPDAIPQRSVIVAVPKQQYLKQFPVMLVGQVQRREEKKGLGIKWLRCITKAGFRRLWQFIETYPELWPTIPSLPSRQVASQACIGYDFGSNDFFTPKAGNGDGQAAGSRRRSRSPLVEPTAKLRKDPPATASTEAVRVVAPVEPPPEPRVDPSFAGRARGTTESTTVYARSTFAPDVIVPMSRLEIERTPLPRPTREPTTPPSPGPAASRRVESPPNYQRSSTQGALTQMIEQQKEELPANIPVICDAGGRKYEGRIRMLSLNSAFLVSLDTDLFDLPKFEIQLPVTLHQRSYQITLACSSIRCGQHVSVGARGIHVQINAVYQPQRPGIFERYVKFLYYQNVTQHH